MVLDTLCCGTSWYVYWVQLSKIQALGAWTTCTSTTARSPSSFILHHKLDAGHVTSYWHCVDMVGQPVATALSWWFPSFPTRSPQCCVESSSRWHVHFWRFQWQQLGGKFQDAKTPSSDITEVFTQLERIKALKKTKIVCFGKMGFQHHVFCSL